MWTPKITRQIKMESILFTFDKFDHSSLNFYI
jgi:hypothetical protein